MTIRRSATARGLPGIMLALLAGCDNAPTYVPYISGVIAASGYSGFAVPAGTTQLRVSGKFFAPGAVVYWDARRQKKTQYVSSTDLLVDLDAGLTANAGEAQLTAQNPGSRVSPAFTVQIQQDPLILTAISPQQIALGAPDTTISLTGSGFRATDVVLWNGVPLATTLRSATDLVATVPASLLAVPGDGLVMISDPGCTIRWLCTERTFTGKSIQVGASARTTIDFGFYDNVWDIAWDATDSLLFASIGGSDGAVWLIDPTSGAFVRSSGSRSPWQPQLAVSDQDRFIYNFGTNSWGIAAEPLRYPLPGLSSPLTLTGFFSDSSFSVQHLAPAPGAPETLAILTNKDRAGTLSVQVVDGTVARARTADAKGVGVLEWGFDASVLYALPTPTAPGVISFNVDGTGITARTVLGSTTFHPGALHFDRTTRRLYGDNGENVNEAGLDSRPFTLSNQLGQPCAAAIDGGLGKAFFVCSSTAFGLTVQSFNLATQQHIANILLDSTGQWPERIVRFGSDGLAVAASRRLCIYRGLFVQ